MAKCGLNGCKNPVPNDCDKSLCGACCDGVGCSRHLPECGHCGEKTEEDFCEECEQCESCCACTRCPNCNRKDFDSLCDHSQDYCDICDGLENVVTGVGHVCDSCADGLYHGGQDNSGY